MFRPHYGTGCPDCPPDTRALIVVKSGLCQKHNEERKKEKKANRIRVNEPKVTEALKDLEKIKSKKFREPTGEKMVFLEIWSERPHYCSNLNCKEYLGDEPLAHYFAHLLSKGAHNEKRLDKSNIVLLCFDCHFIYDNGDRSKIILLEHNGFSKK